MRELIKILLIFFLFALFPKIANSFTSSAYLVSNAAISSFDYETATEYFINYDYEDSSIAGLRKKIISYINSNKLHEANLIARQLILLDNNNEDAWLVLLASAMLNNDLSVIREFEKLNDKEKYTIIDYVFYENGQ